MLISIIILLLVSLYICFKNYKLEQKRNSEAIKIIQALETEVDELKEIKIFNERLVGAITDTMYQGNPDIRLEMAEAIINGTYKVKDFYPDF